MNGVAIIRYSYRKQPIKGCETKVASVDSDMQFMLETDCLSVTGATNY